MSLKVVWAIHYTADCLSRNTQKTGRSAVAVAVGCGLRVRDPDHEEYDDLVEWLGDDFDPDAFDIDKVKDMLVEWQKN